MLISFGTFFCSISPERKIKRLITELCVVTNLFTEYNFTGVQKVIDLIIGEGAELEYFHL